MMGEAEGLAGLPGLCLGGEVEAELLGPHPAWGAQAAASSCKQTQSEGGTTLQGRAQPREGTKAPVYRRLKLYALISST